MCFTGKRMCVIGKMGVCNRQNGCVLQAKLMCFTGKRMCVIDKMDVCNRQNRKRVMLI